MSGIEKQNYNDDYIENENTIQKEIQKANEIINIFKTIYGENSEKYQNILKEYNRISNTYNEAKTNDLKISKEELKKILEEIENLKNIDKINEIKRKNIDELTEEECIIAFNYISSKYNIYKKEDSFDKLITKISFFKNNNIESINTEYEAKLFQDELSKKIFGSDEKKQFNKDYIQGFNNEKGNFLIKIKDFENTLKEDIKNINSRAFANYLLSLGENISIAKLHNILGTENLLNLKKIWNKSTEGKTPLAFNIIEEKNPNIIKIVNLFDVNDENTSFFKTIKEIKNKDDLISIIKISKEKQNTIRKKIEEDIRLKLQQKNLPKNQIEEHVKKITDNFFNIKPDLDIFSSILKVINEVESEYKIEIDFKETVSSLVEEKKQSTISKVTKLELEKKELEEKLKKAKNENERKEIQRQIEKINNNIKRLKKQEKLLSITKKISTNITHEQAESFKKGEITQEDLLKEVFKKNKELEKDFSRIKQEIEQDKKEKQETNTKKDSEIITQKEENQTYYKETQTGNYELTSNSGKKIEIPLTKKELQYIKNEKVKENVISFYTLLNNLNISNLWEYRDDILKVFSNKYKTYGFNIYDDFLDEREQKIFLKGILKSIGINLQNDNINDIKNKFIDANKADNNFIIKEFKKKYIKNQCILKQSELEKNI